MSKFNSWQKILEIITFLVILIVDIYKLMKVKNDLGIVIALVFISFLLFVIFTCVALFPATWRMTEREKRKIKDPEKYQEKYTGTFVIINSAASFLLAFLMLTIG